MKRGAFWFRLFDVFNNAESLSLKIMLLSARRIERFGRGDSSALTPPFATLPPFDEVSSFGQGFPIVAFGAFAARNRDHLPAAIDFDPLENIDASHADLSF